MCWIWKSGDKVVRFEAYIDTPAMLDVLEMAATATGGRNGEWPVGHTA